MSKSDDSVPNKLTPIEMEMIIDDLIRNFPYQVRMNAQLSKLYKARYDTLMAAGFDASRHWKSSKRAA